MSYVARHRERTTEGFLYSVYINKTFLCTFQCENYRRVFVYNPRYASIGWSGKRKSNGSYEYFSILLLKYAHDRVQKCL